MHARCFHRRTAVLAGGFAGLWLGAVGLAGELVPYRVTGDGVNLRALPTNTAEVVGQCAFGERLLGDRGEGDWLAVAVPTDLVVWVHGDFVDASTGGAARVQGRRVHARSGPSLNHRSLGLLPVGQSLQVMRREGDWCAVTPPTSLRAWISRRYVEPVPAPIPALLPPMAPSTAPAAVPPPPCPAVPVAPQPLPPPPASQAATPPVAVPPPPILVAPVRLPDGLPEHRLQPGASQGRLISLTGTLERCSWLARRPAPFRLVNTAARDTQGRTLCYVWGDERAWEALVGADVAVDGHAYWVADTVLPIVAPLGLRRRGETPRP